MGLKPQYPIVTAGGTRSPRCTKWHLRGSLLVFFTSGEGFETKHPLLRLAEPEDPRAQNGI
ncbi:Hypothetical protein FKW44_021300 [Caligus rogercresseyi]|uniref:Uncharacterized protein n=1 Tax=Caligus rogercresseyi TaxID=217165 RepID=A0A7T8GRK5_CALRO|nr:Hypothetical protein FKW44_021300 [Caligus rogercresseyi]